MAFVQRRHLQVDAGESTCNEARPAVGALSPPESLLPCKDVQDRDTRVQRFSSYSDNCSEQLDLTTSLEAALSAFPFLLPLAGRTSGVQATWGIPFTGLGEGTETEQLDPLLRTAAEGLSEAAADLGVEMGELRRSGEQLAELMPGSNFSTYSEGRDLVGKCMEEVNSHSIPYIWCNCGATVAASFESSVLSAMYEKEALQLHQQDVLDTKYQWWRAVRTFFAGRSHVKSLNAGLSNQSHHACCRWTPELAARKTEWSRALFQDGVTLREDSRHPLLQCWAGCCFCCPVSHTYLLKAHEQLYCSQGKTLKSPLQGADCCPTRTIRDTAAGERPTESNAASFLLEARAKESRGRSETQEPAPAVTFDTVASPSGKLQDPAAGMVFKGFPSNSLEERPVGVACNIQSDAEKRRRIWQWLWEAAGALGFCASSRFLAMQLLDAYLVHERCTLDVSKTTEVATAAVAAVLLSAASRGHWRDVKNDVFLSVLLRKLELPSTADDVIQTQADMLRLLPAFLFTTRSPVDYLVCFLSNLRRLPYVLEHSSSVDLTCIEKQCSATRVGNVSLNSEAGVSQSGVCTVRTTLVEQSNVSLLLQYKGNESSAGDCEARKQSMDTTVTSRQPEKGPDSVPCTDRRCCSVATTSIARGLLPVLLTSRASEAVIPAKVLTLFDYWRYTGLLGCLEGIVLRCCSAFVASAALCSRVPVSRLLAVLLLEVFEPYSRYRLQHWQENPAGALSQRSVEDVKVGACTASQERIERAACLIPSANRSCPVGLLEWCRCISVHLFYMQFDSDLLFWKRLLQPLINQLLQLPENRPFYLLWQRGVEEWALSLESCSRATSRLEMDGGEEGGTIKSSSLLAKGCSQRQAAPSVDQSGQAQEYSGAAASLRSCLRLQGPRQAK